MPRISLIVIGALLLTTAAFAKTARPPRYQASLVRVIDGDTLELSINLGFGITITDKCRLLGIDTPEVYGVRRDTAAYQRGLAASRYVRRVLSRQKEIWITPKLDSKGRAKRGKFGRWLITVHVGSTTLKDLLKARNLEK